MTDFITALSLFIFNEIHFVFDSCLCDHPYDHTTRVVLVWYVYPIWTAPCVIEYLSLFFGYREWQY